MDRDSIRSKLQKEKSPGGTSPPASDRPRVLAAALKSSASKQFGEAFGSPDEDIPSWVPSGIPVADILVSGGAGRGFPAGRVTELFGHEEVGKTTMGCALLRAVQQLGGAAVVIDTEASLTGQRLRSLGVDVDGLVYVREAYIERIMDQIEFLLEKLGDTPAVIFVDTVAGAQSVTDRGRKVGEHKLAAHATAMSSGFRRLMDPLRRSHTALVFANQERVGGLGNMFATEREKAATLGGKALSFHSVVRLRMEYARKLYAGTGKSRGASIGFGVTASAIKNKLTGATGSRAELAYVTKGVRYFDHGLSAWKTLLMWSGAARTAKNILVGEQGYTQAQFLAGYKTDGGFRAATHEELERAYRAAFCDE